MSGLAIVLYVGATVIATGFFLNKLIRKRESLGDCRLSLKEYVDIMPFILEVVVLVSWVVIFVLIITKQLDIGEKDTTNYILSVILGVSTAIVISNIASVFLFKSEFYSNGLSASGVLMTYKEVANAKVYYNTKNNKYYYKFHDSTGKQRGALICDEKENDKIKEILRKRGVSVKEK